MSVPHASTPPACLALVLLLAWSCNGGGKGATALPACDWATVERVVDGDTIVVRLAGRRETVRYIGVDTPETVKPDTPVDPFGPEASAANKKLAGGRDICLERDEYGRLLRYPWLGDGTLVSEQLVRAGLGKVVTFPPDVKYLESRYLPAQREAREARKGMWADGRPECYRPRRNSCDCSDFTTRAEAQAFVDRFDHTDQNRLRSAGGFVCPSLPP